MRIILASNSPRRKELLSQIGLEYDVIPSSFEEKAIHKEASDMVKHFAFNKAADVASSIKNDALVIGADTIVYLDKVLGKPVDEEDAFRMLKSLSGKEHYVLTGLSVIHALTGSFVTEFESTKVRMKPLSDNEILNYIRTGEPMDKAGAYAIQGIGSLFIEGITGDYFNVVGLPLFRLGRILESFGVKLLKDFRIGE